MVASIHLDSHGRDLDGVIKAVYGELVDLEMSVRKRDPDELLESALSIGDTFAESLTDINQFVTIPDLEEMAGHHQANFFRMRKITVEELNGKGITVSMDMATGCGIGIPAGLLKMLHSWVLKAPRDSSISRSLKPELLPAFSQAMRVLRNDLRMFAKETKGVQFMDRSYRLSQVLINCLAQNDGLLYHPEFPEKLDEAATDMSAFIAEQVNLMKEQDCRLIGALGVASGIVVGGFMTVERLSVWQEA